MTLGVNEIMLSIVLCSPNIGGCETYIHKYRLTYDQVRLNGELPIITNEWCNKTLPYYIRDIRKVNPSTADIYYFKPELVGGVAGLEFVPETIMCWPYGTKGNEQ